MYDVERARIVEVVSPFVRKADPTAPGTPIKVKIERGIRQCLLAWPPPSFGRPNRPFGAHHTI